MLREREREIINLFLSSENEIIENYLKYLNISKRTFWYYLKGINTVLLKEKLNKIRVKNNTVIFYKNDMKKLLDKYCNNQNMSKNSIKNLIFLYAVFSKLGLNISKLSSTIYISRNTISYMIRNLNYEYKDGRFINLKLKDRAKLLYDILNDNDISKYTYVVIEKDIINKIKEFINKVSNKIDLKLNYSLYINLISYIYCYITFEQSDKPNNFVNYKEFKIISDIYISCFNNKDKVNSISDLIIGLSLIPDIESWINESFC
ncbi:BglG family transcription antiterminator [Caviibacter abscessus]|uniref:hypothetical protein n=1 Tax=Caviibacter abscessus TaxID=1766719 RepID=UPI0008370BA7|nr:hypothetical protein [Caviibacter abscessus]